MHLRVAVTASLLAVLAVMGCGGPPEDGPQPAPTTGSTSSEPSAGAAPESPESTVAPAAGPRLRFESGSLRLPAQGGFAKEPTSTLHLGEGLSPELGARIAFMLFPATGTLDSNAQQFLRKDNAHEARFTRREDTELGGLAAFHVEGPGIGSSKGRYYVSIGALDATTAYTLNIGFGLGGLPVPARAERDEIVESVRASWEFDSRS